MVSIVVIRVHCGDQEVSLNTLDLGCDNFKEFHQESPIPQIISQLEGNVDPEVGNTDFDHYYTQGVGPTFTVTLGRTELDRYTHWV